MTQQILVCNNEPHVVRAISLKFMRAGFDVKAVSDADSCGRYLNSHDAPAVLIVDVSMPRGMELVQTLRSADRLSGLPVIALTENIFEMIEQSELLHSLDIDQIFPKPFSPREVLSATHHLLGHEVDQYDLHCGREYATCH